MEEQVYFHMDFVETGLRNPANLWDVDVELCRLNGKQMDNVYSLHFAPRTPRYYLKIRNLKAVLPPNSSIEEQEKCAKILGLILEQQKLYVRSLDLTWKYGHFRNFPTCTDLTVLCLHDVAVNDAEFANIINSYPQLRKIVINTPQLPSETLITGILVQDNAKKTEILRQDFMRLKTVPSLSALTKLRTLILGPGLPAVNKRCIVYGFATMRHLETLQFYLGDKTDIKLRHVAQHLYHIRNLTIPNLQKDLQQTLQHVLGQMNEKDRFNPRFK